ncbi:hypothetical protein AVEN_261601-1 [Araneus ventricosus]|uniref:Uncharacterized protein n=1 Tax=Araneus ventricosus TaxID=182803 RepID=A0A4Y2XEC5_ARAVE|nr:hypothetical protein AVEN_261601-1 [Araneus ventricosus]
MDRRIWKNFKQDTRVSLLMRCAEEWRQIRLSNQSPPKLQWCSARVQNAYMRPGSHRKIDKECVFTFTLLTAKGWPDGGATAPGSAKLTEFSN